MCTTSHTFQCGHPVETDAHTTCGVAEKKSCIARIIESYEGSCADCIIRRWLAAAAMSVQLPMPEMTLRREPVEWSY